MGSVPRASQIFEYNGSTVVAMVGKNGFAIASDRRPGVQLRTVATDFQLFLRWILANHAVN
jgi:20S proteasome alpha/beta subunit